MALLARAQSVIAPRTARAAAGPRPAIVRPRISPVVRSTPNNTPTQEEDPTAKLNEQLQDALKFVQTKWEETSDAEKPAAIAIIIGVTIAQIAIGATVDAVDRIPFIHQFLEFVGLAVVSVYGYRYVTDPAERDSVKKSIDSFVAAVTGK